MTPVILCLDIGSGTQDALLVRPGLEPPEASPKFVLPTPARIVARRIQALTQEGKAVYLAGRNMGGGFGGALRKHLAAGLPAAAYPEAALALADDPTRLRDMGVTLSDTCPPGFHAVELADFHTDFWRAMLDLASLPYPDLILAAAQDHGHHPQGGNRVGRFTLWHRFLTENHGQPEALLFRQPPAELTRLRALQESIGGGFVADTGAAAVLGVLSDPEIADICSHQGILVVNVGNSHVVAFLVFQQRILGVYEQHTTAITAARLMSDLTAFRLGHLDAQTVLSQGGHGCLTLDLPPEARHFEPMFVVGPRRSLLTGSGATFPAPGGDMMLTGCFGLLHGYELLRKRGEESHATPS